MDKILFSKRLKEQIESKYKTQTAFAIAYDKKYNPGTFCNEANSPHKGTINTIKKYVSPTSATIPSLEKIDNMCKMLDCDIDYLLGNIKTPKHLYQAMHEQCGLSVGAVSSLSDIASLGNERYFTINGVIGYADVPECEPSYILNEYLENKDFLFLLLLYMLLEDMNGQNTVTTNERATALLLQINILMSKMKERHNAKVCGSRNSRIQESE